jgi:hypothetical protein
MRITKLTTLVSTLVFVVLAFTATSALAGNGYENVTGTFGSGPCTVTVVPLEPCDGKFNEPTSVAVNDENEHVYVLDKGNDRVEYFAATETSGTYLGQFDGSATPAKSFSDPTEIAINNDSFNPDHGWVYVADTGHDVIDEFDEAGKYEGQIAGGKCETEGEPPSCTGGKLIPFKGLLDVAVDPSGNVYVFEAENTQAYEFSETGGLLEKCETNEASQVSGFAVDAAGDLYMVIYKDGQHFAQVLELAHGSCGSKAKIKTGASPSASIAIIGVNNDLLVDENSEIELFSSKQSGNEFVAPLNTFPATGFAESAGIAVNGANGEGPIYATQRAANDVEIFSPPAPEAPKIVSESAATQPNIENEGNPEGQFSAMVDAGGLNTTVSFEYSHEATVNGKGELELGGFISTLGAESSLSAEFTEQDAQSPAEVSSFSNFPDRTYYYRAVAENEESKGKPTYGKVEAYTKLPVVGEEKTSELTSTSAILEATVNPDWKETTYAFEYAESKAELENGEGTVVPGVTGKHQLEKLEALKKLEAERKKEEAEGKLAPRAALICPGIAINGATGTVGNEAAELNEHVHNPCPVSAEVFGLEPGHTYYFRVVAENEVTEYAANANKGKPVTLTTAFEPYAPPGIGTGGASDITGTTAALSGEVDPKGADTSYHFAYISQTGYQEAIKNGAANPADGEAAYQAALAKGAPSPYAEGETTVSLPLAATEVVRINGENVTVTRKNAYESQAIGPIPAAGLLPGKTYHYALVATNKYGAQSIGQDNTFTTSSAAPPIVTTGGASGVSQNAATLSGTVTTNGLQTDYGFEIGTSPGNYGPATGLGAIGGSLTNTVSVTLNELQPGTTYYYRVTATNADGTEVGQPASFTTPGFPTLLVAPQSLPLIASPSVMFPTETENTSTTTATTKKLTNAQKLSKALKACRREKGGRRASCAASARRKFGGVKEKKRKGKK